MPLCAADNYLTEKMISWDELLQEIEAESFVREPCFFNEFAADVTVMNSPYNYISFYNFRRLFIKGKFILDFVSNLEEYLEIC